SDVARPFPLQSLVPLNSVPRLAARAIFCMPSQPSSTTARSSVSIGVGLAYRALFKGTKLCNGFTAKDLWKHCIGVAVAARDIAASAKLPIREEAFLAGMTHDLGFLA